MRARSVHLNRGLAVGASNKTALHPRYFLPHLHQQGAASRYNYIITAKKRPSSHLSPVAGRAVRREKTAMEVRGVLAALLHRLGEVDRTHYLQYKTTHHQA